MIKKLQGVRLKVRGELSKLFEPPQHFEEQYLKLLDKIKSTKCFPEEFRKGKLEVILHQERIKLALANTFKTQTSSALRKISETLSSLKTTVGATLMVTKIEQV